MSYTSKEVSNQSGMPIALYRIKWGATIWRYTSSSKPHTIMEVVEPGADPVEVTFMPIPCSDSGMVQGGSSNNDLTLTAPAYLPLTALFESTPPALPIWLTVRRVHRDDPDDQALIYWIGTISNVKRNEGDGTVQIIGKTLLASMKRTGLRLGWVRGCPHILYDSECRVDPEAFAVATTITAMTGNSITVAAAGGHAAGWFDGGYIEWTASDEGTIDRRGISASLAANRFQLLGTTYRLVVGMAIKLYPGCALDTETCDEKFDNLANYGGCEQMTGKNPFDGNAII